MGFQSPSGRSLSLRSGFFMDAKRRKQPQLKHHFENMIDGKPMGSGRNVLPFNNWISPKLSNH
jgi:hypothetical protein